MTFWYDFGRLFKFMCLNSSQIYIQIQKERHPTFHDFICRFNNIIKEDAWINNLSGSICWGAMNTAVGFCLNWQNDSIRFECDVFSIAASVNPVLVLPATIQTPILSSRIFFFCIRKRQRRRRSRKKVHRERDK